MDAHECKLTNGGDNISNSEQDWWPHVLCDAWFCVTSAHPVDDTMQGSVKAAEGCMYTTKEQTLTVRLV